MKTKYFALAALAFAALVSCNKEIGTVEQIPEPSVREGYVQITLSAGVDNSTKAVLDGSKVVWAVGDEVAVYPGDATTAEKFTVKTVDGSNVTITGSVPEGTTSLIAVYPFDNADGRDGNNVKVYIPGSQNVPDGGTIDPVAMSSAAVYTDLAQTPQFKNLFALLAFNVGEVADANIAGIVTSVADTPIAGTIQATLSADAAPVITPVTGQEEDVVEVFTEDGKYFAPKTTYYAVVAPCTVNGFTVGVGNDSKLGMGTTEKALTLERNKGIDLGDISSRVVWKYSKIHNAAELQEFLATADTYAESDKVELANDIDLTGVTLTSAASWAGTFDGCGFSLKNWTSAGVALFASNQGTVKDFSIDRSCKLSFPAEVNGAVALVVVDNKGTVSGITNNADITSTVNFKGGRVAVIVGLCDAKGLGHGITVENCVNNGNITFNTEANTGGTQYVGTIVGSMGNSAENILKDCTNNGKLSIICSGTNTKNFYIGGVAGGTTNGSNNISLKNTGDVTLKCAGHEAALCLAGISSYTTGAVTDCENTGAITFESGAALKATFVSGIAGYFASNTMSGCVNRGAVKVKAGYIAGRNNIGDITAESGKEKSWVGTYAIAAGLTIGGLVSATGLNPVFTDSNNYGKVSLTLDNPTNGGGTYGIHTAARPSMGGLVGDCAGPMTNCNNYGDVDVHIGDGTAFTGKNAGYTLYVGGIVGSSYNFSGASTSGGSDKNAKNKFTLENCSNSGNVSVYTDNEHTTNHAIGGIAGWPQSEDATAVYVAKNCSNSGNITFEGRAKARVAGIHGGTGRMDGCTNTGKITLVSGQAGSVIGSVAGFHSQAHTFSNCVAKGTVEAKVPVTAVGGLAGNLGNVAFTGMDGCSVNCALVGGPEGNTGFIVGRFNGTDKAITLGSADDPIEVQGTVDGTAVNAENIATYFCGATGFEPAVHTVVYTIGG